jgi:hypothetical protein
MSDAPKPKNNSAMWLGVGIVVLLIVGGGLLVYFLTKSNDDEPDDSECLLDSDCTALNPVCRSGVCGPRCILDSECPGTEICRNGTCGPAPVPCSDANPCQTPNVCINGTCNPPCSASTCTAPLVCQSGICAPPCSADNPCQPPRVCRNGVCDFECTTNTGCGSVARMCEGNRCVNIEECTTDAICSPGRFCRNGACTRACIDDAACPQGSRCRGGVCLQTCAPNILCPFQHECMDGVCVRTPCTATSCPKNWNPNTIDFKCNNGVCEPACDRGRMSNCVQGQDCRAGYCYQKVCGGEFMTYLDNLGTCRPTFETKAEVPAPGFNRDPFVMYENVEEPNICLDRCEKHRDCQLAFTGTAADGQKTCTLWSRGVNTTTAPASGGVVGSTHRRQYF